MKMSVFVPMMLASALAVAQSETVLYSFNGGSDGYQPYAGVIFDPSGNLYGTTFFGGPHGYGTVYELSPIAGGGWTESVLYGFDNGSGGGEPETGLTLDGSGNLYGTTSTGGASGNGVVFELSPSNTGWVETVLHTFSGGTDGALPLAGLVIDSSGDLYGTTSSGGTYNSGTVFKVTQSKNGWQETILYDFASGRAGVAPNSGLIFDGAGNLCGTTQFGGLYGYGTVFELVKGVGIKTLYDFMGGNNGGWSREASGVAYAGLLLDGTGNLYGTTRGGSLGCYGGCGLVFELTPGANGTWSYQVLTRTLELPYGGLVSDSAGNIYGTTIASGAYGDGEVFALNSRSNGKWAGTVLYSFTGGADGKIPWAGRLIFDSSGNLYGTTLFGGSNNAGVVFEITP
jgi:uncharacterized repeat protein (TIGR03803 family)